MNHSLQKAVLRRSQDGNFFNHGAGEKLEPSFENLKKILLLNGLKTFWCAGQVVYLKNLDSFDQALARLHIGGSNGLIQTLGTAGQVTSGKAPLAGSSAIPPKPG
jgi:hypothetical protein